MLSPDDRTLLGDLLQPPDEHRLEHAIATTFTLDLSALLTVPLGFAGSDLSTDANKLTLLHAVHDFSNRIDVFCQRGMIKVPDKPNRLLELLEEMIHELGAKDGFLFHPKIWVLRFSPDSDSSDDRQKFRLICGSRNLTFDRSWDAAIVLEGVEQNRRFAVNNPLCDFLRALPARSGDLGASRIRRFTETVERLNNVEWEPLPGVPVDGHWLQFHALGGKPNRRIDLSGTRTLVVSPFISGGGLRRFGAAGSIIVVSRSEQLDMLDQDGREWVSDPEPILYSLNDGAAIRDIEDEDTGIKWDLTGLHAKLYAFERGHYTHVLVGSANATEAGWGGNDEFLVEIVGRRRDFGIDTLVGPDSEFRRLLVQHHFGESVADDSVDDLRHRLERDLRGLAANKFVALISGSEAVGWRESVSTESPLLLSVPDTRISLGLVTSSDMRSRVHEDERVALEWELHDIEQATPFIVLELECATEKVSTVVLAKLVGGPEDRVNRILAAQFEHPAAFLEFIRLLLAASGDLSAMDAATRLGESGGTGSWQSGSGGLLEALLRVLSRAPAAIDDVARLVERLKSANVWRGKVPEDWGKSWEEDWGNLWDSVMSARTVLGDSE